MNEPALICFCYSRFVFSWICGLCFSDLCYSAFSYLSFPFSFPNTRKYFPENFLQCNQTPWKHFPFPKISISGKYVFSEKCFTATKHSLNYNWHLKLLKCVINNLDYNLCYYFTCQILLFSWITSHENTQLFLQSLKNKEKIILYHPELYSQLHFVP